MSRPLAIFRLTKKIRAYSALLLLYLIILPVGCQAAEKYDIVINEIAWMGSKISDIDSKNWWRYEWFELYNSSSSSISLSGWKIELYGTDLDWSLELNGEIPGSGYFLIVSSDRIFSSFSQNYSDLKGRFVNSGQKIVLKDFLGNIIDEVDCSNGWFAGNNENKMTMERISALSDSNVKDNWQNSKNTNGTPGTINGINPIKTNGATTLNSQKIISENQDQIIVKNNNIIPENLLAEVKIPNPQKKNNLIVLIAGLCSLFSGTSIILLKRSGNHNSLDK